MDDVLFITPQIRVPLREIELSATRAQGAGGQHLHKTSSAAQLRFDVRTSSLPADCKTRLLALPDRRIGADGVVTIKAQRHRSLEQNRDDALQRLAGLIGRAAAVPRPRKATQPTRAAQRQRLEGKIRRGRVKALRGRPVD
ncbi:MAG: alternative ribosome rescue aminoacyl-tRNA hydrolase ArfB [Pseudomonadota bacterium]